MITDSYGILKIDFDGIIDGRVSSYRQDDYGNYDFAFGVPLSNSTLGKSAVGFNTYQPSLKASEAGNVVANWLTLVNLDRSPRSFVIDSYGATGNLLLQREVTVDSFGRLDMDGGHGFAGLSVVGQHIIRPKSKQAPYIAQIIRYGGNAGLGSPTSKYSFAFPLVATSGNGRSVVAPISKKYDEENWVEIFNTLSRDVPVDIEFLSESGSLLHSERIVLSSYGQVHLNASTYLVSGQSGTITITPEVSGSVIANSMFYFRNPDKSIATMFSTQANEGVRQAVFGSYNRFLDMENWLRIANTSSSSVDIVVNVNHPNGSTEKTVTIPAGGSTSLPLHDSEVYNTQQNSYGTVVLKAKSEAKVSASILRLRRTAEGYDFGAPTLVR